MSIIWQGPRRTFSSLRSRRRRRRPERSIWGRCPSLLVHRPCRAGRGVPWVRGRRGYRVVRPCQEVHWVRGFQGRRVGQQVRVGRVCPCRQGDQLGLGLVVCWAQACRGHREVQGGRRVRMGQEVRVGPCCRVGSRHHRDRDLRGVHCHQVVQVGRAGQVVRRGTLCTVEWSASRRAGSAACQACQACRECRACQGCQACRACPEGQVGRACSILSSRPLQQPEVEPDHSRQPRSAWPFGCARLPAT